jgi:hypothetical protein
LKIIVKIKSVAESGCMELTEDGNKKGFKYEHRNNSKLKRRKFSALCTLRFLRKNAVLKTW